MRPTLLLLLALPAAAQTLAPEDAPLHNDGVITATVTNTRGEPVAGAWVLLNGQSPAIRRAPPAPQPERVLRHLATDAAGRARFQGLPSGHYNLRARAAGHYTRTEPSFMMLEGSKANQSVNLTLPRKPVFTGRVFDVAGAPVVRAQVKTLRRGFDNGQETLVLANAVSTDDRGVYRIVLEEPGDYWLMASHSERTFPRGAAPRTTGVAFYPNALDLRTAEPIAAAFDQQERTLDLTLPSAPPTSLVGGIAIGSRNQPCTRCRYSLMKVEGPYSYEIVSGGSGRDGIFSYAGIPSGRYRILVEDYGHNRDWWAIQEVTVTEGRPAETLIVTRAPVSVSGRVVLEDPPDNFPEPNEDEQGPIRLHLERKRGRHFFSGRGADGSLTLRLDATEFTLKGLPPAIHRPVVSINGPYGYLASITRDGRPLPSPFLDLTQPGPWHGLELHIRFDLAEARLEIDAAAQGDSGEPAQYRMEIVSDPKESPFGGKWSGHCSAKGRCMAYGLPPGRYRAVALPGEPAPPLDFDDPETWERLSPWARTVDLDPGKNPVIHLTPAPAVLPAANR